MKEIVYLTILFDYYESLLKDDDKKYFKSYYFDNLSLTEVAENNDISRNAVHKRLKKIEKELKDYEKKLKLYEKELEILKLINNSELEEKIKRILNNN